GSCFSCQGEDMKYPPLFVPYSLGCIECIECTAINQYWEDFTTKYNTLGFDYNEVDHVALFQNYLKNTQSLNLPINNLSEALENCHNATFCDPAPEAYLLKELFQRLIDNNHYTDASTDLDNSTYGEVFAELFNNNFSGCNPRISFVSPTEYQLINDCGFFCQILLTSPLS